MKTNAVLSDHHLCNETEIRSVIDKWHSAVLAKNVDAIMEYYDDDIVAFDAILKLQFKGKPAYKNHWKFCMEMCPGPTLFEIDQFSIFSEDNIAFAHWLTHCGGTNEKGEFQGSWMRTTVGYRKINNKWLAVHEHFSSPFDLESGKVIFDAEP